MKSCYRFASLFVLLLAALALVIAPVASQDDLMSFAAADCDYGGNLRSIEAVDELTVVVTLCNPDAIFDQEMASLGLSIHPREYLEATGGAGEILTRAIGTGPLRLVNWDQGNEMVFERFDDYWGEPSIEDTVILRWNSEAAARATELRAGTIDGMKFANPDDIPVFRNDPNFNLIEIPPLTGVYVAMSNFFEPLNDVRVRSAIAMGIDRQRIVDNFFPEGSPLTPDFVPPAVFGHVGEGGVPGYDPEAARAMLEAAAADLGFSLPLDTVVDTRTGEARSLTLTWRDVVRAYLPNPGIIANDIQVQLAEIGIMADVQVVESGAFIASSLSGNEPLHILGWHADFPDATNFLTCCHGPNMAQMGNPYPEVYEPLIAAGQVLDPEERMELFQQVADGMAAAVPWVPFGHAGAADVWQARMIGVHPGVLDGTEEFARIEDPDDNNVIYMQNAEPISLYCPFSSSLSMPTSVDKP